MINFLNTIGKNWFFVFIVAYKHITSVIDSFDLICVTLKLFIVTTNTFEFVCFMLFRSFQDVIPIVAASQMKWSLANGVLVAAFFILEWSIIHNWLWGLAAAID